MSLCFSAEEHERRFTRVRELIRNEKLDALFITGEENFQYFLGNSGKSSVGTLTRPAVLILPLDEEPIAIVHSLLLDLLEKYSPVKKFKTFSSVLGIPNELLVAALRESRLDSKRVGAEFGLEQRLEMPYADFMKLQSSLPDVSFVDAAQIFIKLRMIKSEEEVEYMRKAAEVTGRARQECFQQIDQNFTQRQVARLFSELMLRNGADRCAFVNLQGYSSIFAPNTKFNTGSVLNLDGGAYVRTHAIDFPRIGTFGRANAKQIQDHKSIIQICNKMADSLKPGVKCSEIWRVGQRGLKELGFDSSPAGRMGHGQGMLPVEPPSITRDDDTILEPGLVISVEPSFYRDGDFTFENTFLITNDGSSLLTNETEDLIEIRLSN